MAAPIPPEGSIRLRRALVQRQRETRKTEDGCRTVLLVEDDRCVRAVTQRMLSTLGYGVIAARNAEHALRLMASLDTVEVALIDAALPKISGTDLADKINALSPKTKTLFTSGYSADVLDNAHRDWPFLPKPYDLNMLVEAIESLFRPLDGDGEAERRQSALIEKAAARKRSRELREQTSALLRKGRSAGAR